MSPGALDLIGEQSSRETSFSPPSGDRRSFHTQAPATLLLGRCWAGPGSPEPWAVFATTSDCCSWPKQRCVLPPHVSASLAPASLPSLPPASARSTSQASAGKAAAPCTCGGCWSRACDPVGDSRFHLRVAWLWVEKVPELGKCAENCSVICSLHSTGTRSWLELLAANSWQYFPSSSMAKTADAEWTLHSLLGSAVAGRGQVRNSAPHWDIWTCGSLTSGSPVKELDLQATLGLICFFLGSQFDSSLRMTPWAQGWECRNGILSSNSRMYSIKIENLKIWSSSEHSSSLVPASNGE